MIQAVVFDCFGVLITENWQAFKQEKFGTDRVKLNRATQLNHMADIGRIDDTAYIREIARLCAETPAAITRIFRSVTVNKEVLALVASLKPHYKIGMLSNVSGDWLIDVFTPEEIALFDTRTLSYKLGIAKPDPRAYHAAAAMLGVACNECVYVDDVKQNVIVAQEQGMHATLFTNANALTKTLQALQVL